MRISIYMIVLEGHRHYGMLMERHRNTKLYKAQIDGLPHWGMYAFHFAKKSSVKFIGYL